MYGIYLLHTLKGKRFESVLLTDGAWTLESNCYNQEYGYTGLIPRLFKRKRNAEFYAKKIGRTGPHYTVRPYAGPADPR